MTCTLPCPDLSRTPPYAALVTPEERPAEERPAALPAPPDIRGSAPSGHPPAPAPIGRPSAVRAVIGDELRIPVLWCEFGCCIARYTDPLALGERDLRLRALAVGWRYDALWRLACPWCVQRDPSFWPVRPPATVSQRLPAPSDTRADRPATGRPADAESDAAQRGDVSFRAHGGLRAHGAAGHAHPGAARERARHGAPQYTARTAAAGPYPGSRIARLVRQLAVFLRQPSIPWSASGTGPTMNR